MMGVSIYEVLRKVMIYRTDAGGFYLQRLLSDYIVALHRARKWSAITYALAGLCLWSWAPWYIAASTTVYMAADVVAAHIFARRLYKQACELAEEVANGRPPPPLASFHPSRWKP